MVFNLPIIVNKKALYAVMLAILLPLISYFIVKRKSEHAIVMPPHYYARHGGDADKKRKTCNGYGLAPGCRLQFDQPGKQISVSWDSLKGKIVIADFFFTRCPTICPALTMNMKRLAESINNGKKSGDKTNKFVHFLSFSIDPERDSVAPVKKMGRPFSGQPGTMVVADRQQENDLRSYHRGNEDPGG